MWRCRVTTRSGQLSRDRGRERRGIAADWGGYLEGMDGNLALGDRGED